MEAGAFENGGTLRYRIKQVEKQVDRLETWRPTVEADIVKMTEFQREIREDLKVLTEKVDAIQTRSTTILVSIVTGCVGLMLTILAGTGKI